MITCTRTHSGNEHFLALVQLLDADLAIRDGKDHAFYAQFNKTGALTHAMVAYYGNRAAGCGALKPYEEGVVELKRMFVHADYRRRGLASAVLRQLETWAAEMGYHTCILETGKNQPEAIALYQNNGYGIIPNYGQYEHIENSVCMRKQLAPAVKRHAV